jgi:electron transport complex protein RnfB
VNRVEAIDQLLPQTQCGKCGFGACLPYAQALDQDTTAINRCPPGGQPVIDALARLLNKPTLEPDLSCGGHQPRRIAVIDERWCIGCTLCLQACPVDAIIGASKRMHTVIAERCTGCDLCIAPCPVDCIDMQAPPAHLVNWSEEDAQASRERFRARNQRLERKRARDARRHVQAAEQKLSQLESEPKSGEQTRKRAIIAAAIERARARASAA